MKGGTIRAFVLGLANLLSPLAALAVIARFAFSPRRQVLRGLPDEIRERCGLLSREQLSKIAGRPTLWFHAASAGEVSAVEGLLERLKSLPQPPAIVMTCLTAAGRDKARQLPNVDLAVVAPFESLPTVSSFISAVRPYALILVETELWPNMLELAARAGLRIALVNGRLSDKSFARYRYAAALIAPFLAQLERFCVQTPADAERFIALGADAAKVLVAGNMKYDRIGLPEKTPAVRKVLESLSWADTPLFVAGSTHPGEEEIVMEAFLQAKARFPSLKLILAPRHVERAGLAAKALREKEISFALWSELPGKKQKSRDCLLLNTLGVLPSFYSCAAVSFVGGTLVPVGGHNLMEPALAGSPVVFGPHTFHTRETARLLKDSGGGFEIKNSQELQLVLESLLINRSASGLLGELARKTARSLQGATERVFIYARDILIWS